MTQKLIDIDANFGDRFRSLYDRVGREVGNIFPEKIITEKGEILKIGCNILISLSLITEKCELVFFEVFKRLTPICAYNIGYTDGKTEKGVQIRPSVPILMLRKTINEMGGENWYGNDNDAIIIFETYHCQEAGPSRTLYFLKKINDKQLEILKNWAEKNNEKITLFEIDKIPEYQKKDILIERIILLENLFNPKTAKPL